jgi:hypothetical protein
MVCERQNEGEGMPRAEVNRMDHTALHGMDCRGESGVCDLAG